MAWYYGTFSCGHEGRVNVIGPSKDRQWKVDRKFSKMCPECWEKHLKEKRQKANEEAAKLAKEMELPELFGSEKQVAWANTIRQNLIEAFGKVAENEKVLEELGEYYNVKVAKEEVLEIRDYIIENKTDARYYIDNRDTRIAYIIEKEMKEALKSDEEKYNEKLIEEEKINSIVYPENRVTDVPVEITFTEEYIKLKFERNEDFRLLVKDLGYTWGSGTWDRKLDETTGSYRDRVAEVGNKLLNAGFPVMILDEKIRDMAINGEYEEECTKWIYVRVKGDYKGWLSIRWQGYDDSLYKRARSLPGSKWSSPNVVVKIEHYKEVEDFADLYGFKFTNKAQEIINKYKDTMAKVEVVEVVEVEKTIIKDGLDEILRANNDILESLKDEDK